MSVIGISPSDIVNGAILVGRGLGALREDGGAKQQYQQVIESLQARTLAFENLERFAASAVPTPSSTALHRSAEALHRRESIERGKLQSYDRALGEHLFAGKRRTISRKLGWEFSRSQDVQAYNNRAAPGVDAAILNSILLGANENRDRDAALRSLNTQFADNHARDLRDRTGRISEQIDRVAREIVLKNDSQHRKFQSHVASAHENLQREFNNGITLITQHLQSLKFDTQDRFTQPASPAYQLPKWKRKHLTSGFQGLNVQSNAVYCPKAVITDEAGLVSSSSMIENGLVEESQFSKLMENTGKLMLTLVGFAVYSIPGARRVSQQIWTRAEDVSPLVLFAFIAIFYSIRCIQQLPSSISLLADNSVTFEDAFGVTMRIPFLHCQQLEIFHGFLEVHFKHRPGLKRVLRKQYQLVLGSRRNKLLEPESWSDQVRPRVRLTMLMVVMTAQYICPKCGHRFEQIRPNVMYCHDCHQNYTILSSMTSIQGNSIEELEDEEEEIEKPSHYDPVYATEILEGLGSSAISAVEVRSGPSHPISTKPTHPAAAPDLIGDAALGQKTLPKSIPSKIFPPSGFRAPSTRDFESFKNIALSLSRLRKSLEETEELFRQQSRRIQDCYPVDSSALRENLAPHTFEHYRLEKTNYSWHDVKVTSLNTSQVQLAALSRMFDGSSTEEILGSMSRSRRAQVYRLMFGRNARRTPFDTTSDWSLRHVQVTSSRILRSPPHPDKLEVFAMELIIGKQEGFCDGRPDDEFQGSSEAEDGRSESEYGWSESEYGWLKTGWPNLSDENFDFTSDQAVTPITRQALETEGPMVN